MEFSIESYSNNKDFQLDFGEVEIGVAKTEFVKIINESNKRKSYVIQRDSISNPLDCVFNIVECTWSLLPYESYICNITYRPILPNRKYIDYFCIYDTHNYCCKIIVQGCCIGPKVTSSKTRLIMICDNKSLRTTEVFKLINHRNISAQFMFDNDNVQCPFKINEISGSIKALSCKCFSILFEPMDTGIYKYYLPCLILDQNPIIIELYGFCCYLDTKYIESFHSKIENITQLNSFDSFKNYMSDLTYVIRSNVSTISLSTNIIDFGHTKIGLENSGKKNHQIVCLNNQNKYDVCILWEKGIDLINTHF